MLVFILIINCHKFAKKKVIQTTIVPTKYIPSISYRPPRMCSNICFLYRQATTGHPSLFSLLPRDSPQGFRRYFNNAPVAASPLLFSCKRVTKIGKLSKDNSNAKAMKGAFYCNAQTPKTEEERFKELLKAKEKIAQFYVYVQDALGGSNPTVWEVARSPQTAASPTAFGQVRVTDDLLTVDFDPKSESLGRVQGIITYSDLQQPALTMSMNFYFTNGEYRGSSLCIVGRNPISKKSREMPIVGGTGIFRLARGYCISTTHSYDAATNYGILKYTFYVTYYVDKEEFYVELANENGD